MSNFHSKEQLDQYFKKQGGYKTKLIREQDWDETKLQSEVAKYVRENYPNLIFWSDLSGANLSKRQAVMYSTMKCEDFKIPDMHFIGVDGVDLYLELKKIGTTIYTKSGSFVSNNHFKAQARSLILLRKCGNVADFSVGYEDTIAKLNAWLNKKSFEYLLK